MKLKDIIKQTRHAYFSGDPETDITSVVCDSRQVIPGSLFCCIDGFKTNGKLYVSAAYKAGAAAFCSTEPIKIENAASIVTDDPRKAYAQATAAFYGNPSDHLRIIGVTGTNGKTTVTFMIEHILSKTGRPTGLMGTIYTKFSGKTYPSSITTPDAGTLNKNLALMLEDGIKDAVFEVSSHALSLDRVYGIKFDAAVFTNLTQDHLDFHKTFEDYFQAKLKLFLSLKDNGTAIVNADDAWGAKIAAKLRQKNVISYGIDKGILKAENIDVRQDGITYVLIFKDKKIKIELPVSGFFNVANSLAAIGACVSLGVSPETSAEALRSFPGVKGRFELVKCGQDFAVVVDYAHTPDGLENVLKTAKTLSKKVTAVFGCGGDRDKTKRPLMGKIASELADTVIITSDNPRTEDPDGIINDIEAGIIPETKYFKEADRKRAIFMALKAAEKGDCVVIAGKGHENYQIFKNKTIHFDDSAIAREFFQTK